MKIKDFDWKQIAKILGDIPEGIMILDEDLKIIYANDDITETYLKSGKGNEVIGRYCYEVTHHLDKPCEAPNHTCPVTEFKAGNGMVKIIHKHTDKNKNEFLSEVSAYPIYNDNHGVIGYLHITRRLAKEVEKELELNKIMIGRELQMVKLKEKVEELEKKLKERS